MCHANPALDYKSRNVNIPSNTNTHTLSLLLVLLLRVRVFNGEHCCLYESMELNRIWQMVRFEPRTTEPRSLLPIVLAASLSSRAFQRWYEATTMEQKYFSH